MQNGLIFSKTVISGNTSSFLLFYILPDFKPICVSLVFNLYNDKWNPQRKQEEEEEEEDGRGGIKRKWPSGSRMSSWCVYVQLSSNSKEWLLTCHGSCFNERTSITILRPESQNRNHCCEMHSVYWQNEAHRYTVTHSTPQSFSIFSHVKMWMNVPDGW